jgi:hypothetical protein
MAGGDYGNVRGNKAKTKRGWKPRHQGLMVVPFVPFVDDEDIRKGVVSLARWISGAHGKDGQKNPRFRAQEGTRDARGRSETRLGRFGMCGWKESKAEGVWTTNFAVEREVLVWPLRTVFAFVGSGGVLGLLY